MSIKNILNNDPTSVNYGKISKKYLPSGDDPSSITASEVSFNPVNNDIPARNCQLAITQTYYNASQTVYTTMINIGFTVSPPSVQPIQQQQLTNIYLNNFTDTNLLYCHLYTEGFCSNAYSGLINQWFEFRYKDANLNDQTTYLMKPSGLLIDGTNQPSQTVAGVCNIIDSSAGGSNKSEYTTSGVYSIVFNPPIGPDPKVSCYAFFTLNHVPILPPEQIDKYGCTMTFYRSNTQ